MKEESNRSMLFINVTIAIGLVILVSLIIFLPTFSTPIGFRGNAEMYCRIEGGIPVIYFMSKDSNEETIGCEFPISPIYRK